MLIPVLILLGYIYGGSKLEYKIHALVYFLYFAVMVKVFSNEEAITGPGAFFVFIMGLSFAFSHVTIYLVYHFFRIIIRVRNKKS
ncbi:hypothetical protein AAU57_03440 [Nonlabens sp. YIK11]|nr:hypothetical protein AAU57_03440 [Nonlabens sp. YIK11]